MHEPVPTRRAASIEPLISIGGISAMNAYSVDYSRARTVFVVAFVAQLLGLMGFKLVWPFLPLYLGDLGVPAHRLALWAGLLDFAEEIATVIAAPVWGVLGDRFGRKVMVVRALLGGALVISLITAAPNEYVVLALVILSGLLTGVISPLNALVASVTPPGSLGKVMGRLLAGVFLANTTGPLLGGLIGDAIGFRGGFLIGAGLLAAAAVLVLLLVREPPLQRTSTGEGKQEIGFFRQLSRMVRVPGYPALLVCLGVLGLSGMMLYPILPVLVPTLAGLPTRAGEAQVATAVGLALGVPGVAGVLASWKAHLVVERLGSGRTLLWSATIGALFTAALFFVDSFWWLVGLRAVNGLFLGVAQAALGALVGVLSPRDLYSTAYGVAGSVQSAATALGFLGGGLVGFLFGLHAAFIVSGALLCVVAVVGVFSLRADQARPAETTIPRT
ncbi:MFS transporter [Actinosynnema sp. NPDC053489]|uniref:MFS transporter n=1 Tax=Actinosynnema sp. NPDC053489 TaxID=3363916 RepID=UPI0037C7328A